MRAPSGLIRTHSRERSPGCAFRKARTIERAFGFFLRQRHLRDRRSRCPRRLPWLSPSCVRCRPARTARTAQNADIRFLGKLLGDVIRAYGGEALVPPHRIHSRHLGRPPSWRGRSARRRAGPGCAQPRRDARLRAQLHAVLDAGESGRGSAGQSCRAGRRPGGRAATPGRTRHRCPPGGGAARSRADRAGADRASHRSDAQEHDRSSQPHRRADAPCAMPVASKRRTAT